MTTLSITPSAHRFPSHDVSRSVIPFTALPPGRRERVVAATELTGNTRKLRLGHVHLRVRELDRSLPFYLKLLGLCLTERVGRFAFLSLGDEHHSVALEEVGAGDLRPSRRGMGIAHLAFEAPDADAFATMRRKLLAANVPIIGRNNGISWTMRFRDPDGIEIEIYVDRRHAPSGARLWGGRWRRPFRVGEASFESPRAAAEPAASCA